MGPGSAEQREERCTASGTREEIALRGRVVICLSGGLLTGLSSPLCKNISVFVPPKSHLELLVSHPTEGRIAIVTDAGCGCGGRGSVLRAMGSQGGSMRPVSDQQRADEGCCSVRRSRVVLTPRRWRQVRGVKSVQPGLDKTYPRTTVAKSPVTGESSKETVKTIACGNAG